MVEGGCSDNVKYQVVGFCILGEIFLVTRTAGLQWAAEALDFTRKRAGGEPNSRLKARLNAGSDS